MKSRSEAYVAAELLEEALFNTAKELDAAVRAAFLNRACAQDSALRERIELLLEADKRAAVYLKSDLLELPSQQPELGNAKPSQVEGTLIGRYKLLQEIGEGGMGVVYMAEQQEPVRRRVALKIVKLGMDTAAVVARFEAERQALALMDHPNIARILDGGATETGRPYFVMELVQGVAITEYCDKNHLNVSSRLELFLQVCDAVQSAHQKGIIHRDLKPSNIMVTLHDGVPVPKVIDFGVAKAMNQELTAKTLFTNYGTLIGTPAYMSPEQAEMSGLDVDTRSDIYSLGIILYELLTGTTPFSEQRLRSVGYGEMQKILAHEEPQRLPTRLSTMEGGTRSMVARNRGAEELALRKEVSGDLDSVVMKCLEKDRTRRYESASGIAADIRRYKNNDPVTARPQTSAYRAQKFIARNKVAAALGSLVLLAILLSLLVTTVSYRSERAARRGEVSARQQAQREASRAEDEALRAARFQYASDMNLARLAVEDGNFFRALQLLNRHRPSTTHASSKIPDLRGWEWRQLWKLCQSEEIASFRSASDSVAPAVASFGALTNSVITVGFAPNGKIAFSGGNDRALHLWDVAAKRQVGLIPHERSVTGAAFSPDGRWLATTTDEELIIREWPSQAIKSIVPGSWYRVNTLEFSPDSKLLAFARFTEGAYLWDLEKGSQIANLPADFGWIAPLGLAFSPDGTTLAFMESVSGEIVLWNIRERSKIKKWKAHDWYITRLFYSPDGKSLISASADRTLKIWDLATGREIQKLNYPLGFGPSRVSSPRVSLDGKLLASATTGGGVTITIQEMPTGRQVMQLRGNQDMVSDVAFSPDGRLCISGSYDGTVRFWDLSAPHENPNVRPFPPAYLESKGVNNGFSLSHDGRHLVTIYTNEMFDVREILSGKQEPQLPVPIINCAAVSVANSGKIVAFVAEDGNVAFWRATTGKADRFGQPIRTRCSSADFSPDGRRLAIGGIGKVAICDLENGEVRVFDVDRSHRGPFSLRFSPSGKKVSAGYFDGTVKVWDLTQSQPEKNFLGHDWQVNGITFLPGEQTLVSVSHQIRFWDVKTGTTRQILQPRAALFRTVALSPDGTRLAVGAADGFITLWDMASMQEVATLSGHNRPLMDMRFIDDNTLVSIAVNDVRVWRAATFPETDAIRVQK
jgi:WD40 repeat protein/serine/threonine protein kinase